MANGRNGFHADPAAWVKDLRANRMHTVDVHAHMITPLVEKLVADRPEKKAESQAHVQAIGIESVDHNNKILMPQVMLALTSLPVRLDDMDRSGASGTKINALELSDASLEPVWAKAQSLGCVMFVHPMGSSFGDGCRVLICQPVSVSPWKLQWPSRI